MRIPRLLIALLVLAAGGVRADDRGERLQRWRAALERAAALAPQDPAAAAQEYRAVVAEAGTAGGGGLLEARAQDGLADVLRVEGRCGEAVPLYERSAAAWERLFGADQPRTAVTLHNLGLCQTALESWDAAGLTLRRALAIWPATYGESAPETQSTARALRHAERGAAAARAPSDP